MVLVSILDDFDSSILPVFYNFKDEITKHLLVHDDSKRDRRKAKEIQKGLKVFRSKYGYRYKLDKYMVDEDSMDALDRCAKYIKKLSFKYTDIYINITGGFSTLSTILNHKLFKHGVNFISYDIYDNEYDIINNFGLTKHRVEKNLNITDHFLLKGYEVQKKEFKEFADKYEEDIRKLFEEEYPELEDYLRLPRNKYKSVKNLPDGTIKSRFLKLGLKKLPSHDTFLTGGLFELYIYNLIKDLDYDDIEVGILVTREAYKSSVRNEFDILIMKNNHLHMIECKYKNYDSGKNKPDELIYKYAALSEVIDEDGKMVIVVKNELHKDSEKSYEENMTNYEKRGRLNNIFFKGAVHKKPALFSMHIKSIFNL